ncbi:hypothetical protein ACKVV7_001947 [Pyricularia oryzae]
MNNLALVFKNQGKYEEAEQIHRKILEFNKKVLGPKNPETFNNINNLASVFDNQGKYEEAEQMHRKKLAFKKKVLGPENPSTLASMNNLALVLDNQGKYEEAEDIYRRIQELNVSGNSSTRWNARLELQQYTSWTKARREQQVLGGM